MFNTPLRPSDERPTLHRVHPDVERFVNEQVFPPEHARSVWYVEGAPTPKFNDVIVGPCFTVAGELTRWQAVISSATATRIWDELTSTPVELEKRWTSSGSFLVADHPTPKEHEDVTFQSSRNAAQTQLDKVAKGSGLDREQALELAKAHIALAQAEAFHELATALGNVALGLGGLRR